MNTEQLRGDAQSFYSQFSKATDSVELLLKTPGVPDEVRELSLIELDKIRTRFGAFLRKAAA